MPPFGCADTAERRRVSVGKILKEEGPSVGSKSVMAQLKELRPLVINCVLTKQGQIGTSWIRLWLLIYSGQKVLLIYHVGILFLFYIHAYMESMYVYVYIYICIRICICICICICI